MTRRPYNPDKKIGITMRVYGKDAELVREDAERQGISADELMRRIVLPWVASNLGVDAPDLTLYDHIDVVAEAAKREGLSVREYEKAAARRAALAAMHGQGQDAPALPPGQRHAPSAPPPASKRGAPRAPKAHDSGAHRLDLHRVPRRATGG